MPLKKFLFIIFAVVFGFSSHLSAFADTAAKERAVKAKEIKAKRHAWCKEHPFEAKQRARRRELWLKDHPKERQEEQLKKKLRYAEKVGDGKRAKVIKKKMAKVEGKQAKEKEKKENSAEVKP